MACTLSQMPAVSYPTNSTGFDRFELRADRAVFFLGAFVESVPQGTGIKNSTVFDEFSLVAGRAVFVLGDLIVPWDLNVSK